MTTIREEIKRKNELLERYRAIRLEQITEDLRREATFERANGKFPWRGEFRDSSEIERLYRSRSRWGMRFSFDLTILCLMLGALLYAAPKLIQILS